MSRVPSFNELPAICAGIIEIGAVISQGSRRP